MPDIWTNAGLFQWNLNQKNLIQGIEFENVVRKISAILSRPQYVKILLLKCTARRCFHCVWTPWYAWTGLCLHDCCRCRGSKSVPDHRQPLSGVDYGVIRIISHALQLLNNLSPMEVGDPSVSLQWRHNGRDGASNHQPHKCLLNRLFKAQIKENIKAPRHWPLWWEFTGDRWIPRTNGQ